MRNCFYLILPILLASCSSDDGYLRDRYKDYLKAEVVAPIAVPSGSKDLQNIYPIPLQQQPVNQDFHIERPHLSALGISVDTIRIKARNISSDSWIYVAKNARHVWAQITGFVVSLPTSEMKQDHTKGSIVFNLDNDLYVIGVESSLLLNSSEVRVRHYNNKAWVSSQDNDSKAIAMENKVANYIEKTFDVEQIESLLDSNIGTKSKADLINEGEQVYLDVYLPYSRVWPSMSYALNAGGYKLRDYNNSTGYYYAIFEETHTEQDLLDFFLDTKSLLYRFKIERKKDRVRISVEHAREDLPPIKRQDAYNKLSIILQNLA